MKNDCVTYQDIPTHWVEVIIDGQTIGTTIKARTQNLTETTIKRFANNKTLNIAETVLQIDEICVRHGIQTVIYDPWESSQIATALEELDYNTIAKRRPMLITNN